IANFNITNSGIEAPCVAFFIMKVDNDGGFNLTDSDVANIKIFNNPATDRICFDANTTFQVGAAHFAIFYKNISRTARNFTAYYHATMAATHFATADQNVFRGRVQSTAIIISAGFNGDAIVTGIKKTIFDYDILTGLGITAIGIW